MNRKMIWINVVIIIAMVFVGQVWAKDSQKININTATVKELVKLKRVGTKYAEKIVEYRENNPFTKPEDIMKVPGIGPKTFEENKDIIIVEVVE